MIDNGYFMEFRRKITVVLVPMLPENADGNETMTCHAPCVHKRRRFLFSNEGIKFHLRVGKHFEIIKTLF